MVEFVTTQRGVITETIYPETVNMVSRTTWWHSQVCHCKGSLSLPVENSRPKTWTFWSSLRFPNEWIIHTRL
jgi:hypothetical protein